MKFIVLFATALLVAKSTAASHIHFNRISQPRVVEKLKEVEEAILEAGKHAIDQLKKLETEELSVLDTSLPIYIQKLNTETANIVHIVEEKQTQLESEGNHHIVSLCISYNNIYQFRNEAATKFRDQLNLAKRQLTNTFQEVSKEIEDLTNNTSVPPLFNECNTDACFDNVIVKADGEEDVTIGKIIKKYGEATIFVYVNRNFYETSLSSRFNSTMENEMNEVHKIEDCIKNELGTGFVLN